MTCPLPPPAWWHDYLAGRLTTPQQIYAASLAEYNGQATPERAFFGHDLDAAEYGLTDAERWQRLGGESVIDPPD